VPYRIVFFAQDQIYHVFNRGVAKQTIFTSTKDYVRFLDLVDYYRFADIPMSFSHLNKLSIEDRRDIINELRQRHPLKIEILAFCLMPNHFHLLLKQISSNGISAFMSNVQNGYAKYFNIKNDRSGPLFQSMFKAVRVESDEQLLHVSRYIHLNPSTSYLVDGKGLLHYRWSSLPCYISEIFGEYSFVQSETILGFMRNKDAYKEFILNNIEYQRELDKIKHLVLE